MLRNLLAIATTTAVLIHTLVGCCAHHTHAAECTSSETMPGHGVVHVCQHAASHDESPAIGDKVPEQHHGHFPCHDPECSYLSVVKTDVVRGGSQVLGLPVPRDALVRVPLCGEIDGLAGPDAFLTFPEPLRAQTQVWRL